MSRDVFKLRVFRTADELLMKVYQATSAFPADERFGIQSPLRRAAVSIPVNIVDGSARRTLREYVNFLNVATASSAEVAYLLSVAGGSGFWKLPRPAVWKASIASFSRACARCCGAWTACATNRRNRSSLYLLPGAFRGPSPTAPRPWPDEAPFSCQTS